MKKYANLLLLVVLLFSLCACSSEKSAEKNTGEKTVAREYQETSKENTNVPDTVEATETVPTQAPLPDTSTTPSLVGAWRMDIQVGNNFESVLLVLNADNTFTYDETISVETGLGTVVADGSYATDPTSLVLNFENSTENYDDENIQTLFQNLTDLHYILEGNTLYLMTGNGQNYVFTRQ